MSSSLEILVKLEKEMQFCCGTTCDKPRCHNLLNQLKDSLEEQTKEPKETTND